ncbi:hypothetical protein [Nocardia miyunensis]|uniref:hypothetical protein n=1 Tax=Nocardia miyunensis TaxID=282684 RepID=UPI00082A5188|nr:hypothetical protein [Nocardia miyunensis]
MDKKSSAVELMDSDHAWAAALESVLPAHHAIVLQEIAAAITHYPQDADILIAGIDLLGPTHPLMRNTDLYRSHCREILTRVAAGTDTRPGTAAEVCAVCSVTSLAAPFRAAAVGLYLRMWRMAGLPQIDGVTDDLDYYEHSVGSRIDELETMTRRRLAVATRRLPSPDRPGRSG